MIWQQVGRVTAMHLQGAQLATDAALVQIFQVAMPLDPLLLSFQSHDA